MRRVGLRRFVAILVAGVLASPGAGQPEAADLQELLEQARAVYLEQGPKEAVPMFERALARARSAEDTRAEVIALRGLGNCYRRQASFEEALVVLQGALRLCEGLADAAEAGKVHNSLGLTYWELGRYDAAEYHLETAASLGLEAGHGVLRGSALNNLSLISDERGDFWKALKQYEQVLEIYASEKFAQGEGDTLGNIGLVYYTLGRFRKALEYHQRALAISTEEGFVPAMSADLGNQGLSLLGLGDPTAALERFDRARELAVEADLPQDEAYWRLSSGRALLWLGRHDEALESFRTALATYERIGAQADLAESLLDIGDLYSRLGDVASSEAHVRRAMKLARSLDHGELLVMSQVALGDLRMRRGQAEEAAALYGEALRWAREVEDRATAADVLIRLASSDLELDQPEVALGRALQARAIATEIEAGGSEVEALVIAAESDLALARFESANVRLEEALRVGDESTATETLWRLHHARAMALEGLGRKQEAVAALEEAVRVIEGVRDRLKEQRFRSGYVQDKYDVYIDLVRLLLDLGRIADAFETSERLRARSYLGLIERGGRLATGDVREREIELRERIRTLQDALEEESGRQPPERRQLAVEVLSAELIEAEREYQAYLDDAGLAAFGREPAASIRLGEVQASLGPAEAVMEFVVGPASVVSFVVTRERVTAHSTPIERDNLATRVGLLRDLIAQRDAGWRRPAAGLAEVLLSPAAEAGDLDGIESLRLIPHGVLHYLPFAALPVGGGSGRLVIDDYILRFSPSARVDARGPRAGGSLTVMALAPARSGLRHTEQEVRRIERYFEKPVILLGDRATESAFKKRAGEFRLLHLATHGRFNKLNPLFSGLELEPDGTDDGRLEVHEILGLRLRADLVTLSACETALGGGYFHEVPAGDDFVGLTWAFLKAGSQSVLATLWQVDDRSTLELMTQFYQGLGDLDERAAAESIASAQRRIRRATATAHPFHWASFVLVGEPPGTEVSAAAKTAGGVRTGGRDKATRGVRRLGDR